MEHPSQFATTITARSFVEGFIMLHGLQKIQEKHLLYPLRTHSSQRLK